MRKIALFICFLFALVLLNANPVDHRTALQVAQNFWLANGGNQNVEWTDLTPQTPFTEFSIFGNSYGFVIISGDDCVIPVLGYSLSNEFDPKIPAHIADYLNGINQEIAYYKANNVEATTKTAALWNSLANGSYVPRSTTTVSPLLTTTWDQSPYYNTLCPSSQGEHTVTGCVATATAQIMKYWEWPTTGTGSHSYVHETFGTLSANFGNTTYQWSLMPNSLNQYSSQTQINAVATLMYHVGVGVEMHYGLTASSAYSHDYGYSDLPCPKYALTNFFDYKYTMHSIYKENVTDAEWSNAIRNELDAGRPVLHSGSDTAGGHCFVCDGYDNNNLFHFNWGWGGYCDGYYAINSLSPQAGGTGGNATYTFNLNRGIVVGIEPNNLLRASTENLSFPKAGGSQSFTVFSANVSNSWTATSSQSWLTISPSSGPGNGSTTNVTASATVNNTGASRTATITLSQNGQTCVINVIQNECDASDMCPITLTMQDSYGDGWNGASVTVSSASGFVYGTYGVESGSSAIATINVCPSNVIFSWNSGNYDSECSFTVQNTSEDLLLSVPSITSSVTSWTVTTPCTTTPPSTQCTVTQFPWVESFENNNDCWSINDADGDGNNWLLSNNQSNTGTNCVLSYSYLNDGYQALHANNYLISPAISLPTSGNFNLTFFAKSANTSYPDSILVKLTNNSNPTVSSFTTTLMSKTVVNSSSYQQYTINLNSYRGQTFHLAFIHQSYDGFFIALDDIAITDISENYTITVNSSNNTMGSATGSGTYASGTSITISATAYQGYEFTHWNDGNTNNPRTITVTGNANYTAYFQATTGIANVNMANINIYSFGYDIHIQNAENLPIEIYDMAGKLLYSETTNNQSDKIISMKSQGIYLVNIGNQMFKKVIVKR